MIRSFNIKLLSLLLLLAIGVWSCTKEDDDANGPVELLSFGPTGAMHGDTLWFIGNNLHKVTAIQFTGALVEQKDFKKQDAEQILVIVPDAAVRGTVTLKTPDGDIVSKTQLNFEVAPTVTALTAEARPGANVTLTGTFLNWVTAITFADGKEVTTFVSQAWDKIEVTVPEDAQTGTLELAYSGTEPLTMETEQELKVTLPVVTGLAPNPVKHAENVTISGTNLDLTNKVILTSVSAPITTFVSKSQTELVVAVPAGTRKGKITLEALSGVQTVSDLELDVMLPSVATIPATAVEPGTNITITGTNLNLVDSIAFQNAPAVKTFVSQSASQIVVRVPAGVTEGKVTLHVKNSTLTVQSGEILKIAGAVPPPTIAFPFYKDAINTTNWNGWVGDGWGGTRDYANTTPVREGTNSVKINYTGGYGSPLQLGGANVNVGSYTTFKISIYGAPGSGGKRVSIGINGADKYTITVVEGKWTDYSIPIADLTTTGKITEILVKEYSNASGYSIYVDALGLN